MLKLTAVLATVALAAGAGTAFADSGHDQGRHDDNDNDNSTVLKSDVFGSMPDGPVLFGVEPGGGTVGDRQGRGRGAPRRQRQGRGRRPHHPAPHERDEPAQRDRARPCYCGGTAVGTTKAYAFSADGDAKFEARVAAKLPSPCLAPAVLLNPAPNGAVDAAAYIAATGA